MIGLIVFLALSFLILSHEAAHFLVAKLFRLKIDEFGFGFPPRMFAKRFGETEYSLNWLPFGGFVKIAGENDRLSGGLETLEQAPQEVKKQLFLFQPAWKRSLIILAGVITNFVIGWFLLSGTLMIGALSSVVIGEIQPGSPAEKVGLLANDVVLHFESVSDFIAFVNQNKGKEVTLEVRRGGETLELKATPRLETKPGEGALGALLFESGIPKQGFFTAMSEGLKESFVRSWLTLTAFYELVKGLFLERTLIPGIVGPVGIFSVAEESSRYGFVYLARLIAIISLSLATMNLVPFPALDGGRFFLILIEKIKGSPISLKTEAMINGIGFIFLVLLMIIVTVRDVAQLF